MTTEKSKSGERSYLRIPITMSVEFNICSTDLLTDLHLASSRNVSQTGICFSTTSQPQIDSIIKVKTDLAILAQCIQIENMLFELGGCILGKVVWARPAPDDPNRTDVGVAFIKIEDAEKPEVKEAVSLIS